jgi:hypothetical protein
MDERGCALTRSDSLQQIVEAAILAQRVEIRIDSSLQHTHVTLIVAPLQKLESQLMIPETSVKVGEIPQVFVGRALEFNELPPIEPVHRGPRSIALTDVVERNRQVFLPAKRQGAQLPRRGIAESVKPGIHVRQAGYGLSVVAFDF